MAIHHESPIAGMTPPQTKQQKSGCNNSLSPHVLQGGEERGAGATVNSNCSSCSALALHPPQPQASAAPSPSCFPHKPSPRALPLLCSSHLPSSGSPFVTAVALLLPQAWLPVVASLGLVMSFQSFYVVIPACSSCHFRRHCAAFLSSTFAPVHF
jgi:hypothetical protein